MANALITPQIITREALRLLENEFVIIKACSRAHEDDFKKIGEDLYVRKPVRFDTNSGKTAVIQDVEESWQKVTILEQENVAWEFNSRDLTLTVEQYSERYIKPAVSALCHKIEMTVHELYKKAYHSAGTPGTHPATFTDLGATRVLLSDHAAPYGERKSFLSTDACLNIANQVAGFASAYGADKKSTIAQEEARIGKFVGFETYESQFIVRHTTGVNDGTPLVNGAGQNVTFATAKNNASADASWTQSLVIDGASLTTTGYALEGDVFTIAGVNSLNPASKQDTGKLQNFVVRADANSDGSGNVTLTISPPIITTGPQRTVSAAPADNAAITFMGSGGTAYDQNLSFHSDAISFGMIPLEMPDSVVWGNTQTDNGMSIRVYKWLDGDNDKEKIRLDAMWFNEVVHHDLIARLWGG